jgi:hypothetical protein
MKVKYFVAVPLKKYYYITLYFYYGGKACIKERVSMISRITILSGPGPGFYTGLQAWL